jgi:hypothetical protein
MSFTHPYNGLNGLSMSQSTFLASYQELSVEIYNILQQNEFLTTVVAEKQRTIDGLSATILALQSQVQRQQEVRTPMSWPIPILD